MKTLAADLRYALRGLRRDLGFTVVTSVSLAIGVGAVTAAFAVIDALDFRPLPYAAPHELVVIAEVPRTAGSTCGWCRNSPAAVDLWRSEAGSFRDVAVLEQTGARWYNGDRVDRVLTAGVSANFFSVLGVPSMLGRTFTAEEAESGSARVIVLGYGFWRTHLGGDPTIVGRQLDLRTSRGRGLHTVVGIMPPGFRFLDNQAWLPLPEPRVGAERRYIAIGRLLPHVTAARAAVEVRTLSARLAAAFPATDGSWTATALPLREWVHQALPNAGRGRFLLFGITLFVLLVAALNVASLSISRARMRFRDASIRSALGATRSRLIRQFLTESVALTLIGGGFGVWIAAVGGDLVERLSELNEAGFSVQLDARVLTFALLITGVAGIGAGIVPAWYGTRGRLFAMLGQRGGNDGWGGTRLQAGLVMVEIACSMLLLTAGGLVGKELLRLRQEPGFDPTDLYLVQASLPDAADAERQRAFAYQARWEIGATAGVTDIGLTGQPPRYLPIRFQGSAELLPREESPMIALADSAFFATIGAFPVVGRLFGEADRFGSPPVAVVNETAAARLWPGASPIGHRLVIGDSVQELVEVVGVAPDAKVFNAPLKGPMPPIIYRPFEQSPTSYPIFLTRGRGAARELVPALRRVVTRLTNAPVPPNAVVAMEEMHRREISQERLHATSLNSFAALGLFLASVGIYGIMSYTASQRRREIGIRMALGAPPRRVLLVLLREGLTVAGVGFALGLLGSRLVTRGMQALIPGTSVTDSWVFGGASLVLALVVGLAIFVPAYRAARADPSLVLRE